MNPRYREVCGCETCTISNDLQEYANKARRSLLNEMKAELKDMPDGPLKDAYADKVDNFCKLFFNDDGSPIHKKMWTACDSVGCGSIELPGTDLKLPHMRCILGECDDCGKYEAAEEELASDTDVGYIVFTPYVRCSCHGQKYLKNFDEKPKIRCTKCVKMTEAEKAKWKRRGKTPKVSSRRMRTKHIMPMKDFFASDGVYEKQMKKMYYHKSHVKLLGTMHMIKLRKEALDIIVGLLSKKSDHAERWRLLRHQIVKFSLNTSVMMRVFQWKVPWLLFCPTLEI